MEYLIIVFDTTGFAMQAESFFKTKSIKYEIMPTPREISLSCGISIRLDSSNLDFLIECIRENKIHVKNIFKAVGVGASRKIKKLDIKLP